jgi:hypothetical protein
MPKPKKEYPPARPKNRVDWLKWVQHNIDFALERLKVEGEVTPMFALHKANGTMVLLECWGFTDQMQKEAVFKFVSLAGTAHEVVAISYMAESWGLDAAIEPGLTARQQMAHVTVLPSESERRFEAVSVMLVYRDDANERRFIDAAGRIERDADGNVTGLTPLEGASLIAPDEVESEMVRGAPDTLMPVEPPSAIKVTAAARFVMAHGKLAMAALGLRECE